MSFVDVAIPGVIGLWLLLWPQSMFYGSHVLPDDAKIRRFRAIGMLLLVFAACSLLVKLMAS